MQQPVMYMFGAVCHISTSLGAYILHDVTDYAAMRSLLVHNLCTNRLRIAA